MRARFWSRRSLTRQAGAPACARPQQRTRGRRGCRPLRAQGSRARICWWVWPAASWPRIVVTGMRMPPMHGRPPFCSGLIVIRSNRIGASSTTGQRRWQPAPRPFDQASDIAGAARRKSEENGASFAPEPSRSASGMRPSSEPRRRRGHEILSTCARAGSGVSFCREVTAQRGARSHRRVPRTAVATTARECPRGVRSARRWRDRRVRTG